MPTKLKRSSVSIPAELEMILAKDAATQHRAFSEQIVWIVEQYYLRRQKEAGLFNPSELREGERREVPVFETRRPQQPRQSSEIP